VLRIYANGSAVTSRSIELSGVIVPESPLVICSPQLAAMIAPTCDRVETLPFNGNDVLVLSCASQVADSLGQLANDPGEAGWGSGALRTSDMTLRRACHVTVGDLDPTDPFDLALDGWRSLRTDAFEGLGLACASELESAGGAGGVDAAGGAAGAGGVGGAGSSTESPDWGGTSGSE
jgi:hypothetical protein